MIVALRTALRLEGISQTTLAARTGLSTKHVSQVMTGHAPLSVDVAVRIQRAISTITAEDLMVAQARDLVRKALANQ